MHMLKKFGPACVAALATLAAPAALAALTTDPAAAPDVVVTIRPLHSLTAQVMRGVGEPTLLLDSAASPHSYAMTPSDALALSRADMLIWTGESMETFLLRSLPGLGRDARILTIDDAEDMDLLPPRAGHAHAGEEDDQGGHDHDLADPHLWLAPTNAARIVTAIALALDEIDPANGDIYLENAKAAVREIAALDAELSVALAAVAGKPYVASHDAYQYFDRAYGLAYAGAVTGHPGRPPSARHILELSREIDETGVTCLLTEPGNRPPLIESLAKDKKLKLVEADPLGLSEKAGPGLYAAMMRKLAAAFSACLAP